MDDQQMPGWVRCGAVCRIHGTIYAEGAKCKGKARIIIRTKKAEAVQIFYYHRKIRAWLVQNIPAKLFAQYATDGRVTLIKKGGKDAGRSVDA